MSKHKRIAAGSVADQPPTQGPIVQTDSAWHLQMQPQLLHHPLLDLLAS